MQTVEATYRVTTPMFLGGANQQAELRLPSFKGALRFWWRALAWKPGRDVRSLWEEEATLFGSSDEKNGQSRVSMRLMPSERTPAAMNPPKQLMDGKRVVGEGARYLGYGVMEAFRSTKKCTEDAELTRSCLLAPFEFTVELLFKPAASEAQRDQVLQALKVMGLLGGLGSKSRKGYGSVTLTSLVVHQKRGDEGTAGWEPPGTPEDVIERLRDLLGPERIRGVNRDPSALEDLPEWTAFSPATRLLVVAPDRHDKTPLAVLDRVGREMVRYRSWGHRGKVLGEPSETNFEDDHNEMKENWKRRKRHPERIVFGLPHNYGKPTTQHVEPAEVYDRRASPLLIHVHQPTESSQPLAVLTFLPSQFLPAQAGGISVGKRERRFRGSGDWEKRIVPLANDNLWKPIEDFLDRLLDKQQRKEAFSEAWEVTHG